MGAYWPGIGWEEKCSFKKKKRKRNQKEKKRTTPPNLAAVKGRLEVPRQIDTNDCYFMWHSFPFLKRPGPFRWPLFSSLGGQTPHCCWVTRVICGHLLTLSLANADKCSHQLRKSIMNAINDFWGPFDCDCYHQHYQLNYWSLVEIWPSLILVRWLCSIELN